MDAKELVKIFEEYAKARGERLSVLLVGANALYFYGTGVRHTNDTLLVQTIKLRSLTEKLREEPAKSKKGKEGEGR